MIHIDPQTLDPVDVQRILTSGVAPRPIALVSTRSSQGKANLAPFSFFNAFGSQPPVIAFSPARRGRDGTLKDTYRNLMDTKECVVHAVTYEMAEQMNLASTEYPGEVDEFVKSGFTKKQSKLVQPHRVKESPFHMECKMLQMIHLGEGKGSGNLAVCEVVAFHVAKKLMQDGRVAGQEIDHIGRNGGSWYTRCQPENMFGMDMPRTHLGMGWDQLPDALFDLGLTKNQLGFLALRASKPDASCTFVKALDATQKQALQKAVDERNIDAAWDIVLTT